MDIKKTVFSCDALNITVSGCTEADRPLLLLISHSGDGEELLMLPEMSEAPDFNMVCVSGVQWNHDLSPWYCPSPFPKDSPFTGGADALLELLSGRILPEAKAYLKGTPPVTGIVGYSLAGLFALYSLYRTELFDCAASVSGSLWFPGFSDYTESHAFRRTPRFVYLSLGNKEARTRNPLTSRVEEKTRGMQALLEKQRIPCCLEMNPGNHFRNPDLRTARAMLRLLRETE